MFYPPLTNSFYFEKDVTSLSQFERVSAELDESTNDYPWETVYVNSIIAVDDSLVYDFDYANLISTTTNSIAMLSDNHIYNGSPNVNHAFIDSGLYGNICVTGNTGDETIGNSTPNPTGISIGNYYITTYL